MKKIGKKLFNIYNNSPLASKIRYSYITILIPLLILVFTAFFNMWRMNQKYSEMIESSIAASKFSLDFKDEFDYETYLVIVGNKSYDNSGLDEMLSRAEDVVKELEMITTNTDNLRRLESINKYLQNLRTYTARIKENLTKDNLYEQNMQIWENDVQIVTTLVKDTISEFIYYDIRDVQTEREIYNKRFATFIGIVFAFLIVTFIIISFLLYSTVNFKAYY